MRIVCEHCQTTYIVNDDKIQKDVVRLKCQKCGRSVIARTDGKPVTQEPETAPVLDKWLSPPKAPSAGPKQGIAGWYYSFNGQSFGPFTEQQLLEKFEAGEVELTSFVWNARITGEWKPAAEVEPFAQVCEAQMLPPPPPPPPQFSATSSENMPPLFHPVSDVQNRADDIEDIKPEHAQIESSATKTSDKPNDFLSRPYNPLKPISTTSKSVKAPASGVASLGLPSLSKNKPATPGKLGGLPSFAPKSGITAPGRSSVSKLPGVSKPGQSSLSPLPSKPGLSSVKSGISGIKPRDSLLPPSMQAPKSSASEDSSSVSSSSSPTVSSGVEKSVHSGAPDIAQLKKRLEETPSTTLPPVNLDEENSQASASEVALTSLDLSAMSSGSMETAPVSETPYIQGQVPEAPIMGNPSLEMPVLAPEEVSPAPEHPSVSHLEIALDDEDEASELIPREEVNKALADGAENEHPAGSIASVSDSQPDDEDSLFIVPDKADVLHAPEAASKAEPSLELKPVIPSLSSAPVVPPPAPKDGLSDIDLDDEDSKFFSMPDFSGIQPEAMNDVEKSDDSGIVNASDTSLEAIASSGSVAKIAKTSDKNKQSEDMFDKFDAEQNHEQQENSSAEQDEHSMLIQMDHLRRQESKNKMRAVYWLLGIVTAGALITGAIWFFNSHSETDVQISTLSPPSFEYVEGQEISEDSLNRIAPEDEFFIVSEPATANTATAKPRPKTTTTTTTPKAEKPSAGDKNNSGAASAAAPQPVVENPPDPVESRSDGSVIPVMKRENVAIPTSSAKSDAQQEAAEAIAEIKGSKYANVDLRKPQSDEKASLASGRKALAKTVEECQKRETKYGNQTSGKLKINLVVNSAGKVESYHLDGVPSKSFETCLESKKDRWVFQPRDDNKNISFTQTFTLD